MRLKSYEPEQVVAVVWQIAVGIANGKTTGQACREEKIAGDRATNGVKYLGEKGIDASRVTTRTGAGQAGATDNRRIDVIWVPEGATY